MLRSLLITPLSPSINLIDRFKRFFHHDTLRQEKNHYETLQIPTNATPNEVKKAFYTLSKTCHPDCNPLDPQAPTRFIALSTAYSVLSSPVKRASYDLTILIETQHSPIIRGTYSSVNLAGGRIPSGLSKRRTQFRGPPPSFYSNGGWGSRIERGQDVNRENINSTKSHTDASVNQADSTGFGGFESIPNQFRYGRNDNLEHFNKEQHFRTQENHRKRRQKRNKGGIEGTGEELPKGLLGPFVAVAGILTVGIFLPLAFLTATPIIPG